MLEKRFVSGIRVLTGLYIALLIMFLLGASLNLPGGNGLLIGLAGWVALIVAYIMLRSGACRWFSNPSGARDLLCWGAALAFIGVFLSAWYSSLSSEPTDWRGVTVFLTVFLLIPGLVLISLFGFNKP